jgi:Ca2+-binding EF-hand superfamily protein
LNAFQSNDRNGDGILEMFEFEGLVLDLGIELDNDELDAAFSSIDTNNDKKIVYDEFRTWWKASTAEADVGVTV